MKSHPEYVGYDATIGKAASLRIPVRDKLNQLQQFDGLIKAALKEHWPWRKQLRSVAEWCDHHGAEMLISFYPYQVAKIMHADFRLVIYRKSKPKPRLHAVNENSAIPSEADKAIAAINRLLS